MSTNRSFVHEAAVVFVLLLGVQTLLTLPAQASQATTESLIFDLKNPDAERRREAATQLGRNQERSAVPNLVELAEDPNSGVRQAVVRALNNIRDAGAIPAYVTFTSDSELQIQKDAVAGIEAVYVVRETGFVHGVRSVANFVNPFSDDFDPVTVEPYEQVDPAAIDCLVPLLSASNNDLRESAANVIGTLRGSAALPTIQSRLEKETETNVTLALIRAIILIADREAAKSLIPLTRSSDTDVRAAAIYGLGRLRVSEAVPQLTELYSSGIEERRRVLGIPVSSVNEFQRNVFQSLSLIGDPSSKGLFMDGLSNEEDFYRRFSAEGLGRIGDTSVTTNVARMRIAERSREVKLATGFALFLLGREEHLDELVAAADSGQAQHYLMELGESDIAKLFAYLDSSKPSIQIALLEVIGLRGGRDAIEVAEKATSSADPNVASAANQAVRRLNGRHP